MQVETQSLLELDSKIAWLTKQIEQADILAVKNQKTTDNLRLELRQAINKRNYPCLLCLIHSFLITHNWQLSTKNERFISYLAPEECGFVEPFHLSVPVSVKSVDFDQIINRVIGIISELYSTSIENDKAKE